MKVKDRFDCRCISSRIVIAIFAGIAFGLAGYGLAQSLDYQERKDLSKFKSDRISNLQETIECLTAEVLMLKEYTRWEKISFHNFSPQEVAELDALEEMLKQKIHKYYSGNWKSCKLMKLLKGRENDIICTGTAK
jgi:hypothetical protein